MKDPNGEAVKIKLYGSLAQLVAPELELSRSERCSIADLRARLATTYPAAADQFRSKRVRACVGGALVPDQFVVGDADEVEILPPVSGG